MERKVIQLAGKTLVVSLPSKWARKYGIKKGDSISVEDRHGRIEMMAAKPKSSARIEIALEGPYELIKRKVDVAYKKGAEEILLKFENPQTIKAVEEVLKTTLGFEIVSQEKGSCTVRSVASAVEAEFDSMLKKVMITLLSMGDEILGSASGSKFSELKEIRSYEATINRLTNFCKRVISKNGLKDESSSGYAYCIAWELERIGDKYAEICSLLEKSRKLPGKDVLGLFSEANAFLRDFYNLFYSFSNEKAIKFTGKKELLEAKSKALIRKKSGDDAEICHCLSCIISSVYDMAGPFYAMIL